MDLRQIHMKDVFGPLLGRVWRPRSLLPAWVRFVSKKNLFFSFWVFLSICMLHWGIMLKWQNPLSSMNTEHFTMCRKSNHTWLLPVFQLSIRIFKWNFMCIFGVISTQTCQVSFWVMESWYRPVCHCVNLQSTTGHFAGKHGCQHCRTSAIGHSHGWIRPIGAQSWRGA